jgi:hypothetical protein
MAFVGLLLVLCVLPSLFVVGGLDPEHQWTGRGSDPYFPFFLLLVTWLAPNRFGKKKNEVARILCGQFKKQKRSKISKR